MSFCVSCKMPMFLLTVSPVDASLCLECEGQEYIKCGCCESIEIGPFTQDYCAWCGNDICDKCQSNTVHKTKYECYKDPDLIKE